MIYTMRTKVTVEVYQKLGLAVLSGIASFGISLWVFKENLLNLFKNAIPMSGDGLLLANFFESIKSNSISEIWLGQFSNQKFGWPKDTDFAMFPIGNLLDVSFIKIITTLNPDMNTGNIVHVISISKSFLIGTISFLCINYILRKSLLSVIFSIIFATNSYNLIRSEGHFFLSSTWVIPIAVLVLYISFRSHSEFESEKKFETPLLFCLSLIIGLQNFYYAIFFIIIIISISVIQTILEKFKIKHLTILELLKSNKYYIISLFGSTLGLMIQLIPIILRQQNKLRLTSTADRSPTEAFIFSGNLESLFIEPVRFVLSLFNRNDLIQYLNSQVQWESTQLGLVSASSLLVLLCLFIFKQLKSTYVTNENQQKIEFANKNPNVIFFALLILITLTLYLRSPVNYSISLILNPIRAWGRIEIYLGFIILVYVAYLLSKQSKKSISLWLVPIITLHFFALDNYRESRLDSQLLNKIYNEKMQLNAITIKAMERIFPQNCSFVQLPFYPFPEFDSPNDKNTDYALLDLPVSKNNFRWSYGGIKSTEDFAKYQNLVSEFPNFSRASLETQLLTAENLEPCGIVIDKSFLSMKETEELRKIHDKSKSGCILELPGEMLEQSSRYSLINYKAKDCSSSEFTSEKLVPTNDNLISRIDSPYSLGFVRDFEMFKLDQVISVRVMIRNNAKFLLLVSLPEMGKLEAEKLSVCFVSGSSSSICKKVEFMKNGLYKVNFDWNLVNKRLYILDFKLESSGMDTNMSWGLRLSSYY